MYHVLTFFVILSQFALALVSYAHGGEGLSFTKTTAEGYLIDVDYSASEIEAGASGVFAFKLFDNESRTDELPYDDLWVRILKSGTGAHETAIFAGPIAKPKFGEPTVLFTFAEAGGYTLSVRYNRLTEDSAGETEEMAAEFPLTVSQSNERTWFFFDLKFSFGAAIGVLVAIGIVLVFWTRRRRKVA